MTPRTTAAAISGATVARRFAAQLLTGPPAKSVLAVVDSLLAIQAQDLRGARLAFRARTTGLHATDIDNALTVERSVVVSWVNRGTLHLVRVEDLPWLHALTTPQLATSNMTRLAQEGVSPDDADRAVSAITRALTENGPMIRSALREHIDLVGVRTAGQALIQILFLATLQGLIVRGPIVGREQAFVLVRDWIGSTSPVDADVARRELARRFLIGHGPASDRDLGKWAGITLRDARNGLSSIASEIEELPDGMLDLRKRRRASDAPPPPLLLGAYDPLLHGWISRDPIIGSNVGIVTNNGLFRPFALVAGKAAGLWHIDRGRPVIEPFGPLKPNVTVALDAEVDDVARFLHLGAPTQPA